MNTMKCSTWPPCGAARLAASGREDQRDLAIDQVLCQRRQAVVLSFCLALLDFHVLIDGEARILQALQRRIVEIDLVGRRAAP